MDIFKDFGFDINENKRGMFLKYTDLLLYYNTLFNLTAITDREEIYIKHYLDSILGEKFLDKNSTVIDVGSGAGFPSIPLKIVRNDLKITMLDSLNKRVNFLNTVIKELNLSDIEGVHLRAEEAGKMHYRESYDFAVARAVAEMSVLCEYTLPFVKIGGKLIAYKGDVEEELKKAEKAISILGGELQTVEKYVLPDGSKRSIVVVEKIKHTPQKYPRGQNKPRLQPIG